MLQPLLTVRDLLRGIAPSSSVIETAHQAQVLLNAEATPMEIYGSFAANCAIYVSATNEVVI